MVGIDLSVSGLAASTPDDHELIERGMAIFDGRHEVLIRANALENNFRLYYYDRGRHQLASARVKAPALRQWHLIRVVVLGDHIQGWLDGALLLDYREARFKSRPSGTVDESRFGHGVQ